MAAKNLIADDATQSAMKLLPISNGTSTECFSFFSWIERALLERQDQRTASLFSSPSTVPTAASTWKFAPGSGAGTQNRFRSKDAYDVCLCGAINFYVKKIIAACSSKRTLLPNRIGNGSVGQSFGH